MPQLMNVWCNLHTCRSSVLLENTLQKRLGEKHSVIRRTSAPPRDHRPRLASVWEVDSRFLASGGKQVPLRVRGKGEKLRAEVRDRPPPSHLELRPLSTPTLAYVSVLVLATGGLNSNTAYLDFGDLSPIMALLSRRQAATPCWRPAQGRFGILASGSPGA
ncbi:uncharacterized protein NECHADRAFT_87878 [Fusarium vanettenii 77-13-4]|uniref:Uncharacterized protein n=1 Tax=Fusarium vanettenii (strain ATCC MYA-4622 / CBS 123669 / FGSC 9596 / NRRL 45880 / 77-13-4) TaxID=660122 RepID=C7Z3A2_FUSV7|nr:uncharacterized protein NECHADRAFT_87878 [Fusarium vanettenii 77-13-4]EEU41799.1 predicted protein [Fusarium vanettenii 77-13-4]